MSDDVRLPVIEISPSEPVEEQENLRSGTRTPRPYYHDGEEILQDYRRGEQTYAQNYENGSPKPSPSSTKSRRPRSARSGHASVTGSDSGTEADDERASFAKALPAPTVRPRKGLKAGEIDADVLLTPSQLDDEGRRLSADYFKRLQLERTASREEKEAEQEKLLKIRLAEFARRSSEAALTILLGLCVLCGTGVLQQAYQWRLELLSHVAIISTLVLTYPVKLSVVDGRSQARKIWQRFRVPASFDPATILYPTLLPVLVAMSVAPANPAVILPNIILGLSSLPQRLFPRSSRLGGYNVQHWLITILPLIVAEYTARLSQAHPAATDLFKTGQLDGLCSETLVTLYPLHHALLQPLHYLTTTSLLISELHLLSAALINLSLLAQSPQAVILKSCLWIGGISAFALCSSILSWNVTLMRVPKWKLRRTAYRVRKPRSIFESFRSLLTLLVASSAYRRAETVASDSEGDDEGLPQIRNKNSSRPRLRISSFNVGSWKKSHDSVPHSAIEPSTQANGSLPIFSMEPRPRSNTLPSLEAPVLPLKPESVHSRDRSPRLAWYLYLTPLQAQQRKVVYASCMYLIVVAIVLGPIRNYVQGHALDGQEPVGWALGYLLGQIPRMQSLTDFLGLQSWIPIASQPSGRQHLALSFTDIPSMRYALGAANMRLILIAYWAVVLIAGLLAVFSLTAFVEVDTRRKVFHGVMVAMMLPSTFIDPCACALALTLILTVFLLLEAIRAGQVLPLGNAIGRFVAPYVDGRDLRGPVVVSHIFLLIGCAVPLWFSLASIPRSGSWPWAGWELAGEQREVAMVAGVICVGMGDAAASLIGRRYGRHKWIWVGGKSLEGSAAFAAAVTIGLLASKAWLVLGGWNDLNGSVSGHVGTLGVLHFIRAWQGTFAKAVFCACAASFMEAILTGANDNVVVPIALWLLVRGVRL